MNHAHGFIGRIVEWAVLWECISRLRQRGNLRNVKEFPFDWFPGLAVAAGLIPAQHFISSRTGSVAVRLYGSRSTVVVELDYRALADRIAYRCIHRVPFVFVRSCQISRESRFKRDPRCNACKAECESNCMASNCRPQSAVDSGDGISQRIFRE